MPKFDVDGSTIVRFSTEYTVEELAERFGVSEKAVKKEPKEYAQQAFRADVRELVVAPEGSPLDGEPLWDGADHFEVTYGFAQSQ